MEVHGFNEYGSIDATIGGIRMTIPDSEHDRARWGIAAWEKKGNTIPPYVPPAPTLPDLAPYQFRAMLKLSGNQDALYAFLEKLPDPAKTVAQSKLEFSLAFRRDNDLVVAAQKALSLSDAELDALWKSASEIL